jgi:mannose-6-phosphate isomerase-like protein (cupin superfamily)
MVERRVRSAPRGGGDLDRPAWSVLASANATNGTFELFEEGRPGGPPPHIHRDREEAFYVLEGRYLFVRGHEEIEIEPGQLLVIPRGTRHYFRTLVAPSRTLILVAPAGLEPYFRELRQRIEGGAKPLEAIAELSLIHDSHLVP